MVAWSRVQGIAPGTRIAYLSAVRLFIEALKGRSPRRPELLISFAYHRVGSGRWVAHAAGKYITKILSGMKWLGMPGPDLRKATKMSWLRKALQRLRPSRGTRHRRPISQKNLRRTMSALKKSLPYAAAQVTRAILIVGFYGMLRAREFLYLSADSLTWKHKKSGLVIRGRLADKTHLSINRSITVPVSASWSEAARLLQARAATVRAAAQRHTGMSMAMLSRAEREAIKHALKTAGSSPGCIRPGGNMFWLQQGINKALIHKQGGWTPNSSVPSKHYTRLNGWAAQEFRKGSATTTF